MAKPPKIFEACSAEERKIFSKLATPSKIQDFLDTFPINYERKGETLMSPRRMLQAKTAHCLEGALFAAAVFYYHGAEPLLLDLKTDGKDDDHVVALFKKGKYWGAISKTNHATLRYREPLYESIRELALSYFHEYITDSGAKILRSYSKPFDLRRFEKKNWLTDGEDLWYISDAIDRVPHISLISSAAARRLRKADPIERKAGKLLEWAKSKR